LNGTATLHGATVVITGAGRGIGRAIATGAARAGANVALVARSADQLAGVAREVEELGGRAAIFPCDIRDTEATDALLAETERTFGAIDGLVNAAGVSTTYAPAELLDETDWDTILETNLLAPLRLCHTVGDRMRAGGGGAIVNVSSVGGVVALPRLSAYCASKGGLVGVTESLAGAWRGAGVRVNCVAPAYVRTALSQDLLDHPRFGTEMLEQTPMGRFGEVDEVATVALFFLSRAAVGLTGRTICIDGGWTAH
jgi:gluconate 5-dehydrogenase